ncbi:MAG: cache domain-containing protein [bacterium]|nr:cache domain-containing protein [Candidatus Sumerlaeota bacterium]
MKIRTICCSILPVWLTLAICGAVPLEQKLAPYVYEDTRELVTLVEDAAALMEAQGRDAFEEFSRKNTRWLNKDYYLFIYDIDGNNVFHPIAPELVDKNLMDLRDMNGKPVIRMITDVGRQPGCDASGWVFYLWEERTQLIPMWKSSYIRKVCAPDKKIYLLGSGIYNIKIEREFVKERVNEAAKILAAKGKQEAFLEFRDPSTPFNFLDTYIFVMDTQGRTVMDPSYPTLEGRDLSGLQDATGRPFVSEMIRKLEKSDEAWVQYMWPKPGAALLSRKLIYLRKVKIGDETLIVGSDFYLATPIWMKI